MRKLALILGLMAGTAQATGIEIQVAGQANGTIPLTYSKMSPHNTQSALRVWPRKGPMTAWYFTA